MLTLVPVPFVPPPPVIADWDEKGFPLLAAECPHPECGAGETWTISREPS